MKELSDCPQDDEQHVASGAYRGAIVDRRTNQRLEFAGDDPFVAITLDDNSVEWNTGKKPDGVLIVDIDGITWVCFIEMKGISDTERAFQQLEGGARHFCPNGRSGGARTHGDEHHDAWTAGEDKLHVMPTNDHRTIGVFVTFRALPQRIPQPPLQIANSSFVRSAVQVSKKKPNWAEVSPRALLRKAGVI